MNMDQPTHNFAVKVAIIVVGAILVIGFTDYAGLAWVHDGPYADNLFTLVGGSLVAMIVLILGAPLVAQLAAMIGLKLPIPPVTAPPDPTPAPVPPAVSAPGGQSQGQDPASFAGPA